LALDDDKTQTHVTLTGGTMVSHYRIIEKIGAGGMGEVYLAEDTELNRKVALKFLPLHLCQDADCRARFKREAQAAAKLNHPNIVIIHEVGEFSGCPFFAMENVEGQTLRDFVKGKELSLGRIIELAIQVCEGLSKAHSAGIVHRDIKPSNILIDQDGRAKIVDFGLASVRDSEHLTKTGSTLGTVGYMSPEQARGEEVDARSDLFSFGVVLYELITGRSPFKAESEIASIKNVIEVIPEPLARYKNDVPDDLQRLVDKALIKDRTLRYQHADDLSTDLKRLVSAVSTVASVPIRKQRFVALSLVVLVLLVAVLVLKPWRIIIRPSEEAVASAKCIVVVPFKNQTGDPLLDPLGRMVADWTTQGLLTTGLGEIVPSDRLPSHSENLSIKSVTDSTGASMIVSGSYYRVGDSIQFQAQVIDANARLLQAIAPVYAPTSGVMAGVESVRQYVLGALGMLLDERLLGSGAASPRMVKPPKYEAYQEYIQALDCSRIMFDHAGALEHYRRAYVLDTSFLTALLGACSASDNLGQLALEDSLVQFLTVRRPRLTVFQQLKLDELSGLVSGDYTKALDAMRKGAKLAPGSSFSYGWGWMAYRLNRPREAIEAFASMNPRIGWARDWRWYWNYSCYAYHALGDHEKELQVARSARERFPSKLDVLSSEVQALAALGKVEEVMGCLNESLSLPEQIGWYAGDIMQFAGEELRVHGYEDAAMICFEKAVAWYEGLSSEDLNSLGLDYAKALAGDRQYGEARGVIEQLVSEAPDNVDYQGWLGIIAAKQADQKLASEISGWLQNLKRPYLYGTPTYYRACIAAILGEKDQAVTLLRSSFIQGDQQFLIFIHRAFALESLWDYPPFIELMKPKG
jgi:tetratricopeptide (TPR) repeat protein/predicted Ser/Thr protein kinase